MDGHAVAWWLQKSNFIPWKVIINSIDLKYEARRAYRLVVYVEIFLQHYKGINFENLWTNVKAISLMVYNVILHTKNQWKIFDYCLVPSSQKLLTDDTRA